MNIKKSKIPEFKSIEEEARFWDTHDITDYWDEMEEIELEFIPRQKKEETVTIRIEPKLKERLEKVSRNHGISLSDLARMWFIEKLRRP